jgi:hypothetical protein
MSLRGMIMSLLILTKSYGQQLPVPPMEAARIAEELFAQQDLDLEYEELYETVLQYLSSPLDINRANVDELRSLFMMSESQVQELLAHRAKNGDLLSIYELQSLPSFPPEFIRRLAPFVTISAVRQSNNILKRIFTEPNNYLLLRYERLLEPKEGFNPTQDSLHRFAGTPDKYYARFRVSHPGDFSLGVTIEKDPGEKVISDYYSFHAQKVGQGHVRNFMIGDFQAQFGQGMIMGGGFGMGKGSETILTVRRSSLGFVPWTSASESGFFRGMATTFAISGKVHIHAFASRRHQDAIIQADPQSGDTVASIQHSGLHRNLHENNNRRNIAEDNGGLVLEFKGRSLQAGVGFLNTRWTIPLIGGHNVYDRFDPSGKTLLNGTVFANYTLRNFSFFGEAAQTFDFGMGAVAGVLASVTRSFDVAILARKYERDFWSPYGSAIAENSTARNESGVYWGWKVQPSKRWTVAGYVDLFKFPWLQYRSYSTSGSGHDALVRATWKPLRDVGFFAQVREESKPGNVSAGTPGYRTVIKVKRIYCINADYTIGILRARTRIQLSSMTFPAQQTTGMSLAQDVSIEKARWSLSVRQVVFDTDDFDNRQYSYEPDMWLAYSFPATYGQGTRTMVMGRLRISNRADLWLRWVHTRQDDRDSTGAGLDEIYGPTRNDLKAQLRIKL